MKPAAAMPAANCLRGQRIAFTGMLASMSRRDMARVVRQAGGQPVGAVGRNTDALVLGAMGLPIGPDGRVSASLRRARDAGAVRILSEAAFLDSMGLHEHRAALERPLSRAAAAAALGVAESALRGWLDAGLLTPHDGCFPLDALAAVRSVADLLVREAPAETIAASLCTLRGVTPLAEPALHALACLRRAPELLAARPLSTPPAGGQLLLTFDDPPAGDEDEWSPPILRLRPMAELTATDHFEQAQQAEEEERHDDAAEAYRRAITLEPRFAEAYFNLGNVLRDAGRAEAAIEMYRMAAAHDEGLAVAWYNIADIREQEGRLEEAVEALRAALRADGLYADAHFNLARCYEQLGDLPAAQRHWREYLRFDAGSEWAEIARSRLTNRAG